MYREGPRHSPSGYSSYIPNPHYSHPHVTFFLYPSISCLHPPIPCICAPHTLNTPIWPSSMNLEDVLDNNVGKIKQDLLSRVLQSKSGSAAGEKVYQQVRKGLFKLCSYWTEAVIINQVDSLQSCNL